MNKAIKDLTLEEAKTLCKGISVCNATCPLYTGDVSFHCRVGNTRNPADFDLDETPKFTVAEMAFLEILRNNGVNWLARDVDTILYWYIEKPKKSNEVWLNAIISHSPTRIYGNLPNTMFPQIKWTDTEPIDVNKILSNGK